MLVRNSLTSFTLALKARARCVHRVIAQQVAVFLQVGAAARRVDDNLIAVEWLEHIDVLARELPAALRFARVNMQRAAALLLRGGDHLAAVSGQHANGGFIDGAKYLVHDAAAYEAHAKAFLAERWRDFW